MTTAQLPLVFRTGRAEIDPGSFCTYDEMAVYWALNWGRKNARQIRDLALTTGLNGRKVQEIVQHLRTEHAVPIGVAMSPPHGNFLIDSQAEEDACVALLRTRGLSNLRQAADLKRMSFERYLKDLRCELDVT